MVSGGVTHGQGLRKVTLGPTQKAALKWSRPGLDEFVEGGPNIAGGAGGLVTRLPYVCGV